MEAARRHLHRQRHSSNLYFLHPRQLHSRVTNLRLRKRKRCCSESLGKCKASDSPTRLQLSHPPHQRQPGNVHRDNTLRRQARLTELGPRRRHDCDRSPGNTHLRKLRLIHCRAYDHVSQQHHRNRSTHCCGPSNHHHGRLLILGRFPEQPCHIHRYRLGRCPRLFFHLVFWRWCSGYQQLEPNDSHVSVLWKLHCHRGHLRLEPQRQNPCRSEPFDLCLLAGLVSPGRFHVSHSLNKG